MATLGFGEVEAFPFVDPPDSRLIRDGYQLLEELGAVDEAQGHPARPAAWRGCRSTRASAAC